MNILLIGANPNNSTDGVIVKGIQYLLKRNFPSCEIDYEIINDYKRITLDYVREYYHLIVVCGTPWLWDSFQNSAKFHNLQVIFKKHPKAKKLFFGVGSCLYLKDVGTNLVKRPEEVKALRSIYCNATVIVRDTVAKDIMDHAKIESTLLPCPAYYCYGDEPKTTSKTKNVLIYQAPDISISRGEWQNPDKLKEYYNKMREFQQKHNAEVYCADPAEVSYAIKNGFPEPTVLKDVYDTLDLMRGADKVLSGRVHCSVPAIAQGADVELMALDTRSRVVYDYKDCKDFKAYLPEFDRILKSIFETRKVGTESQRSYELYDRNGFFIKYMSGFNGLDIGYAGYTSGCRPILPTAIGIDKDYPGYNGLRLPFEDNSQDYVYSSHCLEHITDYFSTIREWHRVTRVGGYIVIIVPHKFLYEKKQSLPSRWNEDHKRFYTPGSLLQEVERALQPNSYRIRYLEDGDRDFNYNLPPETHSAGQYEITLVIEKINIPDWNIE